MQHVQFNELTWVESKVREITKSEVVMNAEGGGISFWRVEKDSGFARHSHKGYEYIYVVSGCMDFSGTRLQAGDILLTAAGETHEARALESSTILVFNERKNS